MFSQLKAQVFRHHIYYIDGAPNDEHQDEANESFLHKKKIPIELYYLAQTRTRRNPFRVSPCHHFRSKTKQIFKHRRELSGKLLQSRIFWCKGIISKHNQMPWRHWMVWMLQSKIIKCLTGFLKALSKTFGLNIFYNFSQHVRIRIIISLSTTS